MVSGIATDKNILVFFSNKNTRKKNGKMKSDATSAFIPEAEEFARVHGVPDENMIGMHLHGVKTEIRRERVLQRIWDEGSMRQPIDAIAFFGHGWPSGIQFGFNRSHIPRLVDVMARNCSSDVKVALFACSAAENDTRDKQVARLGPATDGGFADILRDEMVRRGLDQGHVDGHKTDGHTSWNPFLIRFLCEDVDNPERGAEGGAWLVAPRSELWRKWINALKDQAGGMRYRFPFMTEMMVKMELAGYPFSVENPYDKE